MSIRKWITRGRVQEHVCPVCKRVLDAVASISDSPEPSKPKAGDLCICAYCTTVNIFQEDGSIRIATTEECAEIPDWIKRDFDGSI